MSAEKKPRSRKEKVSFNIDPDLLKRIKKIVNTRQIMISDFFREAAEAKLEKEEKYMTIYVYHCQTIKKVVIDKNEFKIIFKDASEDMVENVGAVQEGKLELLDGQELDKYDNKMKNETGYNGPVFEYMSFMDDTIKELFEESDIVYFFTKDRY